MADGRLYVLQPSFASGEISPDVASRVDLDKYQSALLQAKNVFIRPYGSAYRRPGTEYKATLSGTGNVRLKEFAISEAEIYLLEFGVGYINIWQDGVKVNSGYTISTSYTSAEIPTLRFAQSAATLFIAQKNHPVQVFKYDTSDSHWKVTTFIPEPGYIDETTHVEGQTITSDKTTGSGATLTYSGTDNLFTNQVGNWVRIKQKVKVAVKDLNINVATTAIAKETGVIHANAVAWSVSSSGTWTGSLKLEYSSDNENWNTLRTYSSKDDFNVTENGTFSHTTYVRLSGNVTMGHLSATLTVSNTPEETKTLSITVPSATVTDSTTSMVAGNTGWKIVTHGTWTGSFEIQQSTDNSTWTTLRTYSSKDDFNVTETGTFDDLTYIKLTGTIKKGNFSATLTRLEYDNVGYARITAVTDGQHATARIYKKFAYKNEAAEDWALGSWSNAYGYPSAVTFFQDRLVLAGSKRYPYMVWMSRTGDYWNFEVEEAAGEVLDDSAVALSFISRQDYSIKHLVAFTDLIVMTDGNEWTISGSETVTPKQATPKMQTARGCTNVEPELIGGQTIFVQKGGKTVRDIQYNFTTDSYDGMDLSILAKHLTQDVTIVESAYKQEPDSMLFFVLSDGTAICLTYIIEQKVYAWSRIVTDGKIKAVETVTKGAESEVYFVIDRTVNNTIYRYLELMKTVPHTEDPNDYIMLDCAYKKTSSTAFSSVTASWLANKTVGVLADGRYIKGLTANGSGTITLPVPVKKCIVGILYSSVFELPNIELQLNDGTLQGRRKKVAEVILRLDKSLGGRVGTTEAKTDVIKYDEFKAAVVPPGVDPELIPPASEDVELYSGEKIVTVPNVSIGGFNDKGRIVVTSDDPYPLSIASIVRAVVPGG